MESQITVYSHPVFGQVRVMKDEHQEPLFCLKDLCSALLLNGKIVKNRLLPEELSLHPVKTNGGIQAMSFVNESGLYDTIMGSRKKEAVQFRKWVTGEVLPQIRKTGGYIPMVNPVTGEAYSAEELYAKASDILNRTLEENQKKLAESEKRLEESYNRILELRPKAEYSDKVLTCEECLTTTQVAKDMEMTAIELNAYLCKKKIQYWQSGQYMLYAEYARRGYAMNRTRTVRDEYGVLHAHTYLVWTERGRKFLNYLLHGIKVDF